MSTEGVGTFNSMSPLNKKRPLPASLWPQAVPFLGPTKTLGPFKNTGVGPKYRKKTLLSKLLNLHLNACKA